MPRAPKGEAAPAAARSAETPSKLLPFDASRLTQLDELPHVVVLTVHRLKREERYILGPFDGREKAMLWIHGATNVLVDLGLDAHLHADVLHEPPSGRTEKQRMFRRLLRLGRSTTDA